MCTCAFTYEWRLQCAPSAVHGLSLWLSPLRQDLGYIASFSQVTTHTVEYNVSYTDTYTFNCTWLLPITLLKCRKEWGSNAWQKLLFDKQEDKTGLILLLEPCECTITTATLFENAFLIYQIEVSSKNHPFFKANPSALNYCLL